MLTIPDSPADISPEWLASVLDVPVLFIVRNNGWAISTPSVEGFGGDGIVPRVQGYGMAGARVDGVQPVELRVHARVSTRRRVRAKT